MVYVANFCKDLVAREKTATIREMYYVSEGWGISFKSQQESNIVGEDLEVTLGTTREDLGLMPEEDGASVYGDITLLDDDVEINAAKAGKSRLYCRKPCYNKWKGAKRLSYYRKGAEIPFRAKGAVDQIQDHCQ